MYGWNVPVGTAAEDVADPEFDVGLAVTVTVVVMVDCWLLFRNDMLEGRYHYRLALKIFLETRTKPTLN